MKTNNTAQELLKDANESINLMKDVISDLDTDITLSELDDAKDLIYQIQDYASLGLRNMEKASTKASKEEDIISYCFDQFKNYLLNSLYSDEIIIEGLFDAIAKEAEAENRLVLKKMAATYSKHIALIFSGAIDMLMNTNDISKHLLEGEKRDEA